MGFNILYVGFFSLPDKDAAANRVMNNAKALRECGHNVIFIDEQVDYEYESIEQSLHIINGFETWTVRRPDSKIDFLRKMVSIASIKTVIGTLEKVDMIIAYNYPAIALFRLKTFCKRNNIILVSDCTEWYSGKEYSFPLSMLSAIDSFLRMCIIQKKLDGLICISEYLADYYKRVPHTLVVPPLVDTEGEIWSSEPVPFDGNKLNLVYAGNPGKSKEHLLPIIESIDKSTNKQSIVFRIVGITKEQFLSIYSNNTILPEGSDEWLIFLGRKTHSETINIIKSSDYMIFIRDRNRVTMAGFSTKFVEAITCGTAVITTDTGELKKYIEKLNAGYLVNSDDRLREILSQDLNILYEQAKIRDDDSRVFDYRRYLQLFDDWLAGFMNNKGGTNDEGH